jgi:O-antigen ligase
MRRRELHGVVLVLAGLAIPLGEGLAIGALVALLMVLAWRYRELRLRALIEGPTGVVLAGLGLWVAAGLAALALGGEGWQKPSELGRWVPLLAIPAVALSVTCLEGRWLERAVGAFLLALCVACGFALVQYVFNVRPGESLRMGESFSLQSLVPGSERTVAGGFYYHRLRMAHVAIVGFAAFAGRQLFATLSRRRRLLELGALVLIGMAILHTYTRGALVALGVGGLACLPLAPRRLQLAALAAVVCGLLTVTTIPSVRERAHSIGLGEASTERSLVWSRAAEILADHPLGIGLGNYPAVVGRYYDEVEPSFAVRTYPHNMALAALCETGPLGLAGYAIAYGALLLACIRTLRRRAIDGRRRAAAGAGLYATVAILTVGLTHDVLYHNAVALAFAALVGVVLTWVGEPVQGS